MTTIGDQQLVKRMNRSVLLRLLRAQPGLSRARLAGESGLTKSTVSLLVRELIDEGWLSESGAAVADGLGRPSTPLRINVGVRALMGVEIAVETVRLVCMSLQGEVLYSDTRALADSAPAGVCAQVARMASVAHARLEQLGLRLSSIGVCIPGAVDDCQGKPVDKAGTWNSGPKKVSLQSRLLTPVPVTRDNLDVVVKAGWIKKDELCKGVTGASAPAACK